MKNNSRDYDDDDNYRLCNGLGSSGGLGSTLGTDKSNIQDVQFSTAYIERT